MKNVKLILLTAMMLLSMMAVIPATSAQPEDAVARGTVEAYSLESAHDYANNFDYTWTITKSGATQIRVYFSSIDVESNYDFIYVYDASNTELHKITGTSSGWTSWSTGDTIKVRLDSDYSVTKYGFQITQIEYESSAGGGDDVVALVNGVAATSTISVEKTEYKYFSLDVGANAESMHVVLSCGSNDYDFFASSSTQTPTHEDMVFEGYTSGGEDVTYNTPAAGDWYFGVNSWTGTGSFTFTVTVTYPVADTTAPTVSITSPSSGATVSDTVTISVSASDNVGVVGKAVSIDGGAYTTSMSWDTTGVIDGSHTIRARAWDAAGNYGYTSTMTVTVANDVGGDNVLENGVTASSSLSATGQTQMWTIDVASNAVSMEAILTCGSSDYDLYGRLGAEPTTSTYDWRGYTSGGEEVTTNSPGAGTWYVMVRSYSGSGSYQLTVTIAYQSADTTAPTVSISSPSNGATVSGTVAVSVSASDNVGVVGKAISIDGGSYTTNLNWDTTGVADGSHTIRARAWDAATNYGYSNVITVTVSNAVGDNVLSSGVTESGNLASSSETDMWTIQVDANALSMHAVLTCGSADFDLYGKSGAEPTTSVYDWRGYTSGGEDVTQANPSASTWYIMVNVYNGAPSDYQLTVTITYGGGGGTGDKYAVIVGISDYKAINDLSYCDEDATDWYNYLTTACGYSPDNVIILGDGHTSNYPKYTATATEANYKSYLTWLAQQDCDEIAFISSGHGAGDGSGSSYLCAWDCGSGESGEDGDFYDTEIKAILQNALADNIFVFIDHCYSGGIGPEMMSMGNSAKVYCTTTCTEDGYGYDDPTHNNGAWTYYFLEYTLVNHFGSSSSTTMEAAYDYAESVYPHSGGDACMEFDGNTGATFTL